MSNVLDLDLRDKTFKFYYKGCTKFGPQECRNVFIDVNKRKITCSLYLRMEENDERVKRTLQSRVVNFSFDDVKHGNLLSCNVESINYGVKE